MAYCVIPLRDVLHSTATTRPSGSGARSGIEFVCAEAQYVDPKVSFGRGSHNHFELDSAYVSGTHAELVTNRSGTRLKLKCLGRNGATVWKLQQGPRGRGVSYECKVSGKDECELQAGDHFYFQQSLKVTQAFYVHKVEEDVDGKCKKKSLKNNYDVLDSAIKEESPPSSTSSCVVQRVDASRLIVWPLHDEGGDQQELFSERAEDEERVSNSPQVRRRPRGKRKGPRERRRPRGNKTRAHRPRERRRKPRAGNAKMRMRQRKVRDKGAKQSCRAQEQEQQMDTDESSVKSPSPPRRRTSGVLLWGLPSDPLDLPYKKGKGCLLRSEVVEKLAPRVQQQRDRNFVDPAERYQPELHRACLRQQIRDFQRGLVGSGEESESSDEEQEELASSQDLEGDEFCGFSSPAPPSKCFCSGMARQAPPSEGFGMGTPLGSIPSEPERSRIQTPSAAPTEFFGLTPEPPPREFFGIATPSAAPSSEFCGMTPQAPRREFFGMTPDEQASNPAKSPPRDDNGAPPPQCEEEEDEDRCDQSCFSTSVSSKGINANPLEHMMDWFPSSTWASAAWRGYVGANITQQYVLNEGRKVDPNLYEDLC